MEYRFLLIVVTLLLALTCWLTWIRTRCAGFAIGAVLIYYWTIFGAWELIGDLLHGGGAHRYQYLFGKMFGVTLDEDYLATLAVYGLFLCLVAGTALAVAGRSANRRYPAAPIELDHRKLLSLAALSLLGSFLIVMNVVFEAASMSVSGYAVTAAGSDLTPLFVVHQALNLISVLAVVIGIPVLAGGHETHFLAARRTPATIFAYIVMVIALMSFGMIMGNKGEVFFGLVSAVVLYLLNSRRPRWRPLAAMTAIAFWCVAMVDYLRSFAITEVVEGFEAGRAFGSIEQVIASNEAFAAHFSMYGALHHRIPWTWGSSFYSLLLSAIPRSIWSGRPDSIYQHYASTLGLDPGQGYTIHHATGWFLNFGTLGVCTGALLMGALWAALFRGSSVRAGSGSSRRVAAMAVAFACFTGGLPQLIRQGIEGYKDVAVFQFLLPAMIVHFCGARRKLP